MIILVSNIEGEVNFDKTIEDLYLIKEKLKNFK